MDGELSVFERERRKMERRKMKIRKRSCSVNQTRVSKTLNDINRMGTALKS